MRTDLVKSAARVLDLLELLAAAPGPARLSALAERMAIPKSSAFALLGTLVAKGYVEEERDGFRLAERLRDTGWVGGDTRRLVAIARPVMERTAELTGESVFLGMLTPAQEIRYVLKAVSGNPLRYDGALEQTRPAYCTSIGHVLLADLGERDLDDYLARTALVTWTDATPTDPAMIRSMIRATAARGYAHTVDSHVAGCAGVAAAIRGPDGHAVAGMAVIGPTWRFLPSRDAHARAVQAAAAEVSAAVAVVRPRAERQAS
ncbi:IclR family transcriptional regulator [Elioraea sp.]|uniref:IclR family transcriptional regulator n=1 Tax=Elioraea sp. TaxID=2185103 RepID=UPI003F6F02E5